MKHVKEVVREEVLHACIPSASCQHSYRSPAIHFTSVRCSPSNHFSCRQLLKWTENQATAFEDLVNWNVPPLRNCVPIPRFITIQNPQ